MGWLVALRIIIIDHLGPMENIIFIINRRNPAKVPTTEVLVQGVHTTKHRILTREKKEHNDWLRTHPSTNATHESYDLVVTHNVGSTGEIPVTNVLIKGCGP
jgi:nucleoside-triphosphatase THEP1